jgi:hypothetical protein
MELAGGAAVNAKPQVGSIMVNKSGDTLVYVWPDESDHARCFTGVSLLSGDCSTMWRIGAFEQHNIFKPALIQRYKTALRAQRRTA